MGECSQNVDVCGCLCRCSLAKQLVPTQKYIGNGNQFFRRIYNTIASLSRVVLIHLLTEQV